MLRTLWGQCPWRHAKHAAVRGFLVLPSAYAWENFAFSLPRNDIKACSLQRNISQHGKDKTKRHLWRPCLFSAHENCFICDFADRHPIKHVSFPLVGNSGLNRLPRLKPQLTGYVLLPSAALLPGEQTHRRICSVALSF